MTDLTNTDALLSPTDLARLVRVAPITLAGWRVQGRGPTYIKVGRLVRYRRSDVQGWLDGQRVLTR